MTKKMLLMKLECPQCRELLTEGSEVVLDAYIEATQQDGQVALAAVFGDYSLRTDIEIPDGAVAQFRCPRCDASLMVTAHCKLCGAPMASLNIEETGYLEFCSRRGCKAHSIGGTGDIDEMMNLMNRMMGTPYD
jgi:predicted RNA-binding Zn-ribbon protein involved in translation (DUF1610 family)